jgi:predicted nucleotide-binding protein
MASIQAAIAKLAGIKKAVDLILAKGVPGHRPIGNFSPEDVAFYFGGAAKELEVLREALPDLYGDFPEVDEKPKCEMGNHSDGTPTPNYYYRDQVERLQRRIEQIFEIRANSELAPPEAPAPRKVFISHGRAKDWYAVQAYIHKDLGLPTIELAQEPNKGLTVLGKLEDAARQCDSAVIVMTGDDKDEAGFTRARENVMHEIGYFQAKYGLSSVVLLHEEGVNIPSNIQGLVYIPFPLGTIEATFGALARELRHLYP